MNIDYRDVIEQMDIFPSVISSLIADLLDPPLPRYNINFDPHIHLIALNEREDQIKFIEMLAIEGTKLSHKPLLSIFSTDDRRIMKMNILTRGVVYNTVCGLKFDVEYIDAISNLSHIYIFDRPNRKMNLMIKKSKKLLLEHKVPIFIIADSVKDHIYWTPPITYIRIIKNRDDLNIMYKGKIDQRILRRAMNPNDFFLVEVFQNNFYFIPRESIEG